MKLQIDRNSPLLRTIRKMQESGQVSRLDAAVAMATAVYKHMSDNAPKDTNRYVRGWALAAISVGIDADPPALRKSRHREALADVLAQQVNKIAKRLSDLQRTKHTWYDAKGRKPDKHSRKLDRDIAKQEARLEKAQDRARQYGMNEQAIVIMRRSSAALVGYQKNLRGDALMAEIRLKVYGGRGSVVEVPGATIVVMHNLEPHSRAIEKRYRVFANAIASVKQFGMTRIGRSYMKKMLANTGGFGDGAEFRPAA